MLTWFRARVAAWATIVLCSFTAVDTLSALHEIQCGDELTEGFTFGHHPGSHTVAATHASDRLGHCVICHWLRSFNGGGVRTSRPILEPTAVPARIFRLVQHPRTAARLEVPSRAPPA